MSIADVRKVALAEKERIENEEREAIKIDSVEVSRFVREAIAEIKRLVERFPDRAHHKDHWIGNRATDQRYMNAWVTAVQGELAKQGYASELEASLSRFSNIGDPYFMGKDDDRETYSVRIRTIV